MVQSVWSLPSARRGEPLKLDPGQRAALTEQIGDLYEHGFQVVECYKPPDWNAKGTPVPADKVLSRFENLPRGKTQLYLTASGSRPVELSTLQPMALEAIFALDARPEGGNFALANRVKDLEKSGWSYDLSARTAYRHLQEFNPRDQTMVTAPDGKSFPVVSPAQLRLLTEMPNRTLPAYVAAATNAPGVVAALTTALESGRLPAARAFEAVDDLKQIRGISPERAAQALQSMLDTNTTYEESLAAIRPDFSTGKMPPEEGLQLRCRLMTAVGPKGYSVATHHAGKVHSSLISTLRRKYPWRGSAGLDYKAPEAVGARQTYITLVEQGWSPEKVSEPSATFQIHGGSEYLVSLGQWLPREEDLGVQARRFSKLHPAELPLNIAALVFNSVYRQTDEEVKAELERFASMTPEERNAKLAPEVLNQMAPILLGSREDPSKPTAGVQEERTWVIVGGVRVPKRVVSRQD